MAHPERNERQRLRPAPLLFEPSEAASDPEHFFDLESMDDPKELLARATELTLAFRPRPTGPWSSRRWPPRSSPIRAGSTGSRPRT